MAAVPGKCYYSWGRNFVQPTPFGEIYKIKALPEPTWPDKQIKTVKEHTFGLEPYDVAKKIYEEHIDGDTGELVLDGRPDEFRK